MRSLVSVKQVVKTKKLSLVVPEELALRMDEFEKRIKKHKNLDIHLDEAITEQIEKILDRAETELTKIEESSVKENQPNN